MSRVGGGFNVEITGAYPFVDQELSLYIRRDRANSYDSCPGNHYDGFYLKFPKAKLLEHFVTKRGAQAFWGKQIKNLTSPRLL